MENANKNKETWIEKSEMNTKLIENVPKPSSEKIDEIARGYEKSQMLFVGIKYDIFTMLKNPKTAKEISKLLQTDLVITEKYLNALVAMGLIRKENDKYFNTDVSSTYLVKDSQFYQGNLIMLMDSMRNKWEEMDKILKNGNSGISSNMEGVFNKSFIYAMAEGAMRGTLHKTLKAVSSLDEFRNARKLLDLGGGHGLYAIGFAQLNPELKCVVFDLPPVIEEVTNEFIKKYVVEDKVSTIKGDLTKDDIGNGYDIVFVSDVLYRKKEMVIPVLKKIYNSLNENGTIILKHWVMNEDRTGPLTSVLFDLELAPYGNQSHIYTVKEYTDLLKDVGFSEVKTIDVSTSICPSVIFLAKKKNERHNGTKIEVINIDDAEKINTPEGIMKPLTFGENISSIYLELPPNLEVPAHSHPMEIIMYCIEGNFKVMIDGEEKNVKSGDVVLIPYNAKIGIKNTRTTAKTIISSYPSSAESREAFINKIKKFQKD